MALFTLRPGHAALLAVCALAVPGAAARAADIVVTNGGSAPMRNLHVTPIGALAWGHDRLGDQPLASGERRRLSLDTGRQCHHDVRAVYDDGREETRFGVDLCRQPALALDGHTETSAGDLRRQGPIGLFVARNRTGKPLMTLTFRRYHRNGYEAEDLLGAAALASGATITARFPRGRGCVYDLIAGVATEGPPRLLERVNLCSRSEVVFEPRNRGTRE